MNGATLVLTYDAALASTLTPAAGDFTVKADASAVTVSNVRVSGTTVILTLTAAVTFGQTVTVDYTLGANPLQDSNGNAMAALTAQAVTNATPALTLAYMGGFTEAVANDGSVTGSVTATLSGDTFTATVVSGGHVTASNVPTGLTASFRRDSATAVTLTLTGNADSHADSDDENALTVTFADGAFAISMASQVTNATKSDLTINFNDPIIDYDTDNDHLIDITTLEQLNAMRYDLDGNGTPTGAGPDRLRCRLPHPRRRHGLRFRRLPGLRADRRSGHGHRHRRRPHR